MKMNSPVKIACVGDSITENGYPSNLGKMLGDNFEVINFGLSGMANLKSATDHVGADCDYRNCDLYKKSLEYKPDIVILMFGTNDSKTMNWGRLSGNYITDYLELIESYKMLASVKKIYICTPPTAFSHVYDIDPIAIKKEVVPMTREVAHLAGLSVIDVNNATKELEGEFADGVHPSSEISRDAIAAICCEKVMQFINCNMKGN